MNKFLAGITLISLLLIILGINRGFDISDEGLYVLLADPAQENIAGIFNYDLFFKLFYKITGIEFGIVGLRIFRLCLYFTSAISLVIFWKNLTGNRQLSFNIFFLALLGLFAGYGFLPQSLSYNSLSVALTCFWLTLLAYRKKNLFHYFGIGFILALLFYIKIPTSLILGLISLVYFSINSDLNWKAFVCLVIPVLFLEIIFCVTLGEYGFLRLAQAIEMMSGRDDYQLLILLKYSAVGLFWLAIVVIPFFAAGALKSNTYLLRNILLILGVISLCAVSYFTMITAEWNHVIILGTAAALAFSLGYTMVASIGRQDKLLFVLLILLPFALHLGSNVYFLRLAIHYWIFWLIALHFLIDKIPFFKTPNRVTSIFGALALIIIFNGVWYRPFEQEPLWKSTNAWEYKPGKSIMLSNRQVELLKSLNELVRNEKSILSIYQIPGLPYLLNKTVPKSPGFWSLNQLKYFYSENDYPSIIFYYPFDSLPPELEVVKRRKILQLPNGEELQILWKD